MFIAHLIHTSLAFSFPEIAHIIAEWLKHLPPDGMSPVLASSVEVMSLTFLVWLSITLTWKALPYVGAGVAGVGWGIEEFHSRVNALIDAAYKVIKHGICCALRAIIARLDRKKP